MYASRLLSPEEDTSVSKTLESIKILDQAEVEIILSQLGPGPLDPHPTDKCGPKLSKIVPKMS